MSLSPAVLTGVSAGAEPLFAQLVGFAVRSQNFWFSSKSMFVVPDGFWTRDQKSCRNFPEGFPEDDWPSSLLRPNAFRSLLFGGIEPATIVGFASFSDVPWPNASSP